MSPEVDRSSKIGLLEKIRADGLKMRSGSEFKVLVDPHDGGPKWCDAKAKAAARANHNKPAQVQPIPNRAELMEQTKTARRDRQEVPVIIETEGTVGEIDKFLATSGIEVEFLPV